MTSSTYAFEKKDSEITDSSSKIKIDDTSLSVKRDSSEVPVTEFVTVSAYDARRAEKKKFTTLSVKQNTRQTFFSSKPCILALLQRLPINPLAEESDEKLMIPKREGEHFITPEAFALLLYRDIKKYEARKNIATFNTQNIIEFDNNPQKLHEFLFNLKLKENEDLKLAIICKTHAVACYLRNEKGRIKCYIGDSWGVTPEAITIARYMESCFDKVDVTVGPQLQKDMYSCFTFARKLMKFYIKQGNEIFSHIEKVGTSVNVQSGLKYLTIENTPPGLLKLSQMNSVLPEAMLNTVVSIKENKTLQRYFAENTLVLEDKTFNTAAIKKKYRYLSQLHETLHQLDVKEINSDGVSSLPPPVINAIQHHYVAPEYTNFVAVCNEVVDFLDATESRSKNKSLSPLAKGLHNYLCKRYSEFLKWYRECETKFHHEMIKSSEPTTRLYKVMLIGIAANNQKTEPADILELAVQWTKKLNSYFNNMEKALLHLMSLVITTPENMYKETENIIKNLQLTPI
ncbi:MAG: hypothetical protein ACYCQI_03235 [Gammaproteobacteria bacterium]